MELAQAWKAYIHNKQVFHGRQCAIERDDNEFPWKITRPKSQIIYQLTKIPYLQAVYRRILGKPVLPGDDLEKLYEVRCLLADDISRAHFDDAVIVRKVSEERFFIPRNHFDTFAQTIEHERFLKQGYPDNYLGLPLHHSKITIGDTSLELIAADGFVDMLNIWRQYLISREHVNFTPNRGDIVLDCGACIGDMTTIFAALVGPSGQVHAFDPIPLHNKLAELQRAINPDLAHAMIFVPSAVGDKTAEIRLGGKTDSDEITPGTLELNNFNMTTIDKYVSNAELHRVDFIKMDIEGFEREALAGAKETIQKFKPKLAISIYHRADDFWHLPLQINALNLGYKFAFGHHSPLRWESVIYAY